MSDWRPGANRAAMQARAALYAAIRAFFETRQVLEVETPLVARCGVTDPAIEPLLVTSTLSPEPLFLQSSPEFAMKRLLAAGSGAIYQLGKAFRDGEAGARHNPEFTMLEWYRPGYSLDDLIGEVGELVATYLERNEWRTVTYRELFLNTLSLDPLLADTASLAAAAARATDVAGLELDRDGWLDLLMTHCIEPALKNEGMVFVRDYPASQAALARVEEHDGQQVASRFELYVDGMELANGYYELLDAEEHVARAERDNTIRHSADQPARELDPLFHKALQSGLPECSGVALGVDRLLMLQLGAKSVDEVMAFAWGRT